MGINMTLVPEAVRALRRSGAYLRRFATLVSAVLIVVAVTWAALIVLADPLAGNLLVGADHWADARNLLGPILVFTMATVALSGPQMILRALANARLSLRAGIVSSVAGLAVPIALAFAGTTPAAWGLALGAIIGLAAWWAAARIGIRAHVPGDGADDGLPPGFGGGGGELTGRAGGGKETAVASGLPT
jgi:O-antigen/teichoic acid export membrane protein